ncbi:FAD/NAD(P)-binding protein [Streptomyces sp. NPDC048441]|uniref:FAD/NAD(P)-binding protein n=1 Tax=Streptomyces sp. NPDC048441 TaxID=3365552 RepID=UPI00371F0860
MSAGHDTVCVIGAGPRGLSVLERLCANARSAVPGPTLHIHVVDPYPPGSGRVWRTDQSHHLLMNTVAGQISVFTDASVDLQGPLQPGPSLHEWATSLPADGAAGHPPEITEEIRDLGPDTYPTRALYGHYLQWAYRRTIGRKPVGVTVTVHRALALTLDDGPAAQGPNGPRQQVRLDNGTHLEDLDAVILCQGHLPARAGLAEQRFAARAGELGLTRIEPANPADVDLGDHAPGTKVILRGLGLNFFDYMALLTAGRGGTFTRREGRLLYHRSGNEPLIYAGSRRGIPYQARGANEKGPNGRHEPLLLTTGRIAELRRAKGPSGVDFTHDLWPLITREVEVVYYRALLTARGHTAQADAFQSAYLNAATHERHTREILDAHGISDKDRWDWEQLARPYLRREFTGPADFTHWLLDHLRQDLTEAQAGNVSGPLKAALDVMRDLRNEIRLAVDHGGLHGDSHRDDLDRWYTPLNAYLSIGPPARRIEELIALIEAGVLHIVGPGMRVTADENGYTASSPLVPASHISAPVLIEARLPDITLRRTDDDLLRHLLATGQCTTYRIGTPDGGRYETDGVAVTPRPFHLLDAADRAHPRRFAFGVPTESVHWVTAAGIRPCVNSVTLTDSDAIARAALACGTGQQLDAADGLGETAA